MSKKYPGGFVTNLGTVGYSVYFDGTGDYLSVADNAAFAFGSGSFTIECWVYMTGAAQQFFVSQWNSPQRSWGFLVKNSGTTLSFVYSTTGSNEIQVDGSIAAQVNVWTHFAAVRNGNTLTTYMNGVQIASASVTGVTLFDASQAIEIARNPEAPSTWNLTGYASNVRVVKGTALYTAAFTPPTQLFNVTNTSLLTCNSPAIVDQSSNNFAITVNGNTAVSTFTPFPSSYYFYNAPTDGNTRNMVPSNIAGFNPAYGAAAPGVWTLDQAQYFTANRLWPIYDPYYNLTTLMLPGNGTNGAQNNTFLDSSTNNFTITRNGNTTQGTFSPFSQTGWSNYFLSGNYITAATSADFALPSDFTLEAWVYPTSAYTTFNYIFVVNVTNGLVFYVTGGNLVVRTFFGTDLLSSATIPALNTWTHVAATRSGTTLRIFVNGVQTASTTNSTSFPQGAALVGNDGTNAAPWLGYISNVRLVKGTALYTSNFTPSTTPLTAVSGTSLLTCQSNRFIDNSANAFAITVAGSPSVQAFSPFAPTTAYSAGANGGSGYGGSGVGYLLAPASSNFQYPGDFSVEMWVYTTTSNIGPLWGTASAGQGDQIYLNGTTSIFYDLTSFTYFNSASSVVQYAWSHICITRQSGTLRVMINGILIGTKAQAGTLGSSTTAPGIFIRGGLDDQVAGPTYMTDLRVCKGSVPTSYQTSSTTLGATIFTPPTQAVTTTSQGATAGDVKLLVNYTNAGITDATAKNVLETVGNAQISTTQSKFGGSSMAFDGSGDYLTGPLGQQATFGTGDFTIEVWIYWNSIASGSAVMFGSGVGWTLYIFPNNKLQWGTISPQTPANLLQGNTVLATGRWYHVAITRQSGTVRMWLDGVLDGSVTDTSNYSAPGVVNIGISHSNNFFNGYMDDLRITKGYARYTANFTPPTSGLQQQ